MSSVGSSLAMHCNLMLSLLPGFWLTDLSPCSF